MKRLVLLCCVSIMSSICFSQYSGLLHPILSNLAIDTKNIVTDFNYSVKGNEKVQLQWKVSNIELVDFFAIERSANGRDFELVELVKTFPGTELELIDESPLSGRSFLPRSNVGARKNGLLYDAGSLYGRRKAV